MGRVRNLLVQGSDACVELGGERLFLVWESRTVFGRDASITVCHESLLLLLLCQNSIVSLQFLIHHGQMHFLRRHFPRVTSI